jgi:exopolysaccharide biosynthesis predicted pyruvyltransferase EpsI
MNSMPQSVYDLQARSLNPLIIDALQCKLRSAFAEVLPRASDYAILDFPNHPNIGDSAIYLGETLLCREHFGVDPLLVAEARQLDLDRVASLDPRVPLLLHGGGNFGDLYPRHQKFREAVIQKFPERKIVLLPQSIHYQNGQDATASAKIINKHSDLTIMVRDHKSFAFAKSQFSCSVMLVPDMAFMIGHVAPRTQPWLEVLGLIRKDKESALLEPSTLGNLPTPFELVDWPTGKGRRTIFERLPSKVRAYLPASLHGRRPENAAAYRSLAARRVEAGFNLLARGKVVLTDRLHAHIMSILMYKPHVVLDNSYGKIGNYADAWTNGGGFLRARSVADAIPFFRHLD